MSDLIMFEMDFQDLSLLGYYSFPIMKYSLRIYKGIYGKFYYIDKDDYQNISKHDFSKFLLESINDFYIQLYKKEGI